MIFRITRTIPLPNYILGLAGLIPFWGLTFIVIFAEKSLSFSALKLQIAYGAVILSFLGGIHWGIAVHSIEKATWPRMGWGIILSLVGWGAIFIPHIYSLVLLGLALISALVVDLQLVDNYSEGAWYRTLRFILSFGAISALLFTLFHLVLS
jgi:hypothetical protein